MPRLFVEICCGSAEDVTEAALGGADRVELNSALFLGGLTPSLGSLDVARSRADIPIICMVRPREGGFHYTDTEFSTALRDAELLLEHGCDGLAFGFLTAHGQVDKARCRALLSLAASRQTVFHRAFDVTPDWRRALDDIMDLGFTRVLTSGQAPTALAGADLIRQMTEHAAAQNSPLEILPGSGIRPENAAAFAQACDCRQIHMTLHQTHYDHSASANPNIHFGGALYPPENAYRLIDRQRLSAFTGQGDKGD